MRWERARGPRVAVVCAGLALFIGGCVAPWAGDEPTEQFCTAEGWIWPNGEMYGRSGTRDCQFVDANGDPLTHHPDGKPICYGERMSIVDCDEPGARRPR